MRTKCIGVKSYKTLSGPHQVLDAHGYSSYKQLHNAYKVLIQSSTMVYSSSHKALLQSVTKNTFENDAGVLHAVDSYKRTTLERLDRIEADRVVPTAVASLQATLQAHQTFHRMFHHQALLQAHSKGTVDTNSQSLQVPVRMFDCAFHRMFYPNAASDANRSNVPSNAPPRVSSNAQSYVLPNVSRSNVPSSDCSTECSIERSNQCSIECSIQAIEELGRRLVEQQRQPAPYIVALADSIGRAHRELAAQLGALSHIR